MVVSVSNAQREAPVHMAQMTRLARCAVRRLRLGARGTLAITFIDAPRMQALNRRFLRHDRTTDVLSFRYDGEPVVGDILISPTAARRYAREHRLPYAEELARYVVHGLLHWKGYDDHTKSQQRAMREMEDVLLARCYRNRSAKIETSPRVQ
jgi:probable rRNA maturation factor